MYISRGDKTKRILQQLRHHACTAREIIESVSPTSTNTFKVSRRLLDYNVEPKFDYNHWKRQEEKRFYTLLAKLHQSGLIKKQKSRTGILWRHTTKGIRKLLSYDERKQIKRLPLRKYKPKKTKHKILIIFDIPEKWRNQRAWLRHQITAFGFEKLQQSVWMGTYSIPADFIHDIREMNLLKYIHIFEITKTGSIFR